MAELSAQPRPARTRDVPGSSRRGARGSQRKGEAQQATAAGLDLLRVLGWLVLHDVDLPGDDAAEVDHVLAGPSGVYVVNTVSWSGAIQAEGDTLTVGKTDHSDALLDIATAAAAVRALLGGTPVAPLLCFERLEPVAGFAGDVALCATENILDLLTSQPQILDAGAVAGASRSLSTALRPGSGAPVVRVVPPVDPVVEPPAVSAPAEATVREFTGPTLEELVRARSAEQGRAADPAEVAEPVPAEVVEPEAALPEVVEPEAVPSEVTESQTVPPETVLAEAVAVEGVAVEGVAVEPEVHAPEPSTGAVGHGRRGLMRSLRRSRRGAKAIDPGPAEVVEAEEMSAQVDVAEPVAEPVVEVVEVVEVGADTPAEGMPTTLTVEEEPDDATPEEGAALLRQSSAAVAEAGAALWRTLTEPQGVSEDLEAALVEAEARQREVEEREAEARQVAEEIREQAQRETDEIDAEVRAAQEAHEARARAAREALEQAQREAVEAEAREIAEREEQERLEQEARERAEREEVERLEAERLEAERLEQERLEQERLEQEARERAEREEAERLEAERLEAERLEAERLEAERLEAERLEAERLEREEQERLEQEARERAEREEAERLEAERLEAERLEQEARERAEREEAERLEAERLEAERLEREEQERLEQEAREQAEREEAERLEAERLEQERLEQERLEREAREQAEREEAERLEAERLEHERLEAEQAAVRERAERKRENAERRAREKAERKARQKAEREAREQARREEQERLLAEEATARATWEARLTAASETREREAREAAAQQAELEARSAVLDRHPEVRRGEVLVLGETDEPSTGPATNEAPEAVGPVVEVPAAEAPVAEAWVAEAPVAEEIDLDTWEPATDDTWRADVLDEEPETWVPEPVAPRRWQPRAPLAAVEEAAPEVEPVTVIAQEARRRPLRGLKRRTEGERHGLPARAILHVGVAAVLIAGVIVAGPRLGGAVAWGRQLFAGPAPTVVGTLVKVPSTTEHPAAEVLAGTPVDAQVADGTGAGKGKHLVAVPFRVHNGGTSPWAVPVAATAVVKDNLGVSHPVARGVKAIKGYPLLPARPTVAPGQDLTGYAVFAVPNGRTLGSISLGLARGAGEPVTWQVTP